MAETINKAPRGRPTRQRVGVRNRLEIINKQPDREYRLIDSDPARVWQFEQAGWVVEDVAKHLPGAQRVDNTKPVDNSIPVGGGAKQILVSIEKEFAEEDRKVRQDEITRVEDSLKNKTSEGFYGKIDIQK